MSEVKPVVELPKKPLIEDDGYFVLVSHRELDNLIGRMMQVFELNGDVEQRNALKQETKWRCREWLDEIYRDSGYVMHELTPGTKVIKINRTKTDKQ